VADVGNEPIGGHDSTGIGDPIFDEWQTSEMSRSADTETRTGVRPRGEWQTSEMSRSADTRARGQGGQPSCVADVGNEPIGGHAAALLRPGQPVDEWQTSEMSRSADTA